MFELITATLFSINPRRFLFACFPPRRSDFYIFYQQQKRWNAAHASDSEAVESAPEFIFEHRSHGSPRVVYFHKHDCSAWFIDLQRERQRSRQVERDFGKNIMQKLSEMIQTQKRGALGVRQTEERQTDALKTILQSQERKQTIIKVGGRNCRLSGESAMESEYTRLFIS